MAMNVKKRKKSVMVVVRMCTSVNVDRLTQYCVYFYSEEEECDGCSTHAHCLKGFCVCVDHYIGNGYHCQPVSCTNCPTTCVSGTCPNTSYR
ncbi:hypothetical protein QZH41_012166 [Actinostola sp. cb2023]|nr:hypothetical protein QZH41_012166 [Actinostola sp. cb2023]